MNKEIKALDNLVQEVGKYRKSGELEEVLNFVKKFPKLAPFNAFMVYAQKPGSDFVAYASEWEKRYGRFIKTDARPLIVLRPFGPIDFVFELGDTYGEAPFPEQLLRPFKTEGDISEADFNRLVEQNLPREGIRYKEADWGLSRSGHIQKARDGDTQFLYASELKDVWGRVRTMDISGKVMFEIHVNRKLTRAEKVSTIIHELAHLYCGHLGPAAYPYSRPARTGNLPEDVREFEAEGVNWLICERLGLKNSSVAYLSNYLGINEEIPKLASIESILRATGQIENMLAKLVGTRKGIEILPDNAKKIRKNRRC